jgi:hypothetical protein
MKQLIYVISLLVAFFYLAKAQDDVELFGYFEPTVMGAKVQNKTQQLYTNKLRVDLKSSITDYITFAANFDYITYHGTTEWNILDFLSSEITSTISENMRMLYTINFTERHFLDNAYLKLALKHFDLILGKQQISLGSGYVWNPLDVFNIKDPLDPTYEQPGHNAIRLDVPVGLRYSITAIYSADDTWKNSAKLLRFKGGISHFDYSLVVAHTIWRFHDYTQFDFGSMDFVELPEQRQLLGASLAGELLGLGTWAEYGYNQMDKSEDFYELVIGLDYTFDFQTYFMIEYYRNTLGKTNYKQYDLNDWMRQFTAEQKAISRDQIYTFIRHPVTDFIDLGASCIFSISDKSLAVIPTLNYSFAENMDIMAYLNFNLGKEGTAYSKSSGKGGLLRARVYF